MILNLDGGKGICNYTSNELDTRGITPSIIDTPAINMPVINTIMLLKALPLPLEMPHTFNKSSEYM